MTFKKAIRNSFPHKSTARMAVHDPQSTTMYASATLKTRCRSVCVFLLTEQPLCCPLSPLLQQAGQRAIVAHLRSNYCKYGKDPIKNSQVKHYLGLSYSAHQCRPHSRTYFPACDWIWQNSLYSKLMDNITKTAHNQNSALGHQNSEKQLSIQRMDYIATCKIVLINTAHNNWVIMYRRKSE